MIIENFGQHRLKAVNQVWKVGDIVKKNMATHMRQEEKGVALPVIVVAKLTSIGRDIGETYGNFTGVIVEPEFAKGQPKNFYINLGGHMSRKKFIEPTEEDKKYLNRYLSTKQFDL